MTNWRFVGRRCPKCGDQMIVNHTGIECGSMHCTYRESDRVHLAGLLGKPALDIRIDEAWCLNCSDAGCDQCTQSLVDPL